MRFACRTLGNAECAEANEGNLVTGNEGVSHGINGSVDSASCKRLCSGQSASAIFSINSVLFINLFLIE